jgi:hypothetical protein
MTLLRMPLLTLLLALTIGAGAARAQDGAATTPAPAANGDATAVPQDGSAATDAAPTSMPATAPPDAAAAVHAATAPPSSTPPPVTEQSIGERIRVLFADPTLGAAMRAIVALFLFLFGWLFARLAARGVLSLTRRLLADPRVVETLGFGTATATMFDPPEAEQPRKIEEIVSQGVYYLLLLLVAIGVLEIAGVAESSGRLRHLLDAIVYALPLVGRALLTLIIAFVVGRVLQKGAIRFLESVQIDRRFGPVAPPPPASPDATPVPVEARLSDRIGRITFWLIMTFGLVSALEALQIGQVSGPLRRALEKMTDLLPAIGAAALIMLGGYLLGRMARAVVRNLLEAAGFNRLVRRLQLHKPFKKTKPAEAVGHLAMLFVLVQAGIAALNQLELKTLANPLTAMMSRLYSAIPALGLAILLIGIGVVAARLVRSWVDAVLKNVGFDRLMERIGLGKLRGSAEGLSLPSEVVAFAAQIAVILVAAAQGLEALELMTWAGYVNAILAFAVERLAVALLIVVLGFGIGTYVRSVILARRQAENAEGITWIAGTARYAVLVFAFTVAIHQLGVAEHFVRTAFVLLFGSLCLALALALGLGGRDVAGELVRRQFERARGKDPDAEK